MRALFVTWGEMSPICSIKVIYKLQIYWTSLFLILEMHLEQEKCEIRGTERYPRREDPITLEVSCKNNLYRSLLSQTALDLDFSMLQLHQVGKS